jgi:energy-coupling factor transporter transmembrane protein EcfT
LNKNAATRTVASTLGILVGLAGIEHGIFEMLQGNVATNDVMIEAIGFDQRFWTFGTERALTIVPNFLATGILAVIFGILVTTWSAKFVDKKHGATVLLALSVMLWLFGGGFAPIFMTMLAFITANRINKPLKWEQNVLSNNSRNFLSKLWPWSIIALVLLFVVSVEIAIFGYPLLWLLDVSTTYAIQAGLALVMILLMPVSIFSALAVDTQR